MPRIAHVISTRAGDGGAEQILAALVHEGRQRGWEQLVLNPMAADPRGGSLRALCAGAAYKPYQHAGIRGVIQMRRWLSEQLNEFEPCIVHTHLAHAQALVASLWRRPQRVTILTHHHGDHFEVTGARVKRLIDRVTGLRYDCVVGVSDYVASYLREQYKYKGRRVVAIANGWSGTPLAHRATGEPTIVCIANFRPQKDHRTLLTAFRHVLEVHPRARLRLVGSGDLRAETMREAGKLDLLGRVEFSGPVRDIWSILATADVFVLPSTYEPFGLVVVEAMGAGVPVVATAVGGVRDIVITEANGLLVPPGDHDRMALDICRLLVDGDLAERLVAAGKATARRFRVEPMVGRYFDLYDELAGQALRGIR